MTLSADWTTLPAKEKNRAGISLNKQLKSFEVLLVHSYNPLDFMRFRPVYLKDHTCEEDFANLRVSPFILALRNGESRDHYIYPL